MINFIKKLFGIPLGYCMYRGDVYHIMNIKDDIYTIRTVETNVHQNKIEIINL